MALAGDGHITVAPETYSALSRAGFLPNTPGLCKTFRKDAYGYARGEGVGVVVLKRLEDAVADKDNILAVVRGAARNYSWDATSITQPSATAQAKMVEDILRAAGVEPNEVRRDARHRYPVWRYGRDRDRDQSLWSSSAR